MQQVIPGRRVRCRDMGHRLCVPALLVARADPGRYGRAGAHVTYPTRALARSRFGSDRADVDRCELGRHVGTMAWRANAALPGALWRGRLLSSPTRAGGCARLSSRVTMSSYRVRRRVGRQAHPPGSSVTVPSSEEQMVRLRSKHVGKRHLGLPEGTPLHVG